MTRMQVYILLLNLFTITVNCQEIGIEIDKRMFENSEMSLLLVSDEDGVVKYEEHIKNPVFDENYKFSFFSENENEKLNLTIYNEYVTREVNIGNKYYRARTYQNVTNGMVVEYKSPLKKRAKKESRQILIEVSGVEELNEIIVNSGNLFKEEDFNIRKGKLRVKYNHQEGSDIYLILKCNDEKFRYIYVEEKDVSELMQFDWSVLNTDLDTYYISLPNEEEWFGKIRAINEDTQGECYLYETKQINNLSVGQIKIFIPQKYFFYDYEILFSKSRKEEIDGDKGFIYYIKEDEIPKIKKIEELAYEYRIDQIDNFGFEISSYDNEGTYNVIYKYLTYTRFQTRTNLRDMKYSYWIVEGELGVDKSFTFPQIPKYYENIFESLENIEKRSPNVIKVRKNLGEKNYILISETIVKE